MLGPKNTPQLFAVSSRSDEGEVISTTMSGAPGSSNSGRSHPAFHDRIGLAGMLVIDDTVCRREGGARQARALDSVPECHEHRQLDEAVPARSGAIATTSPAPARSGHAAAPTPRSGTRQRSCDEFWTAWSFAQCTTAGAGQKSAPCQEGKRLTVPCLGCPSHGPSRSAQKKVTRTGGSCFSSSPSFLAQTVDAVEGHLLGGDQRALGAHGAHQALLHQVELAHVWPGSTAAG